MQMILGVHTTHEVIKMEQKQPNKFMVFVRNNGFYLVLVLCLLAVGTAIALMSIPSKEEEAAVPSAAPEQAEILIVGQSNDEPLSAVVPSTAPNDVSPVAAATLTPTPSPSPAPTATPQTKTTSSTTKAAPPVSGEIIWDYATDKLLYSVTLDQWTTHSGVDLAADVGAEVKSVLSGTVEQVYEDDRLCVTVVVRHSNDRTSLYANLDASVRVKVGDKVNAGAVLGVVGDTAISECGLKPHVHFAFFVHDASVDPKKYVRLG